HTFSTILIANGENIKVVQELMRHASSRCTLEVQSQARILARRQAQQRVVQMILPTEADAPEPLLACESQIGIRWARFAKRLHCRELGLRNRYNNIGSYWSKMEQRGMEGWLLCC